MVGADLTDGESTRGSLEGVDVAYHLVHSLGARNFSELGRRVAENVVAEAERAGVAQIVYLGGLGDDAADLSSHLRSRTGDGRAAMGLDPRPSRSPSRTWSATSRASRAARRRWARASTWAARRPSTTER